MMTGLLCACFAVPACVRIRLHFLMFTAAVIPVSASLAAFAIDLLFMCSGGWASHLLLELLKPLLSVPIQSCWERLLVCMCTELMKLD